MDLSHALCVLLIQSPSSEPFSFLTTLLAAMNTHLQHEVPSLENTQSGTFVSHITTLLATSHDSTPWLTASPLPLGEPLQPTPYDSHPRQLHTQSDVPILPTLVGEYQNFI